MAKVELQVFYASNISGILRQQASSPELGRFFSHIPPENRKVTAAHHCLIGGEATRDYWYSHDTGKRGDLKLCRAHEVLEVPDPRGVAR